jgi:hypothetical protein
MSEPRPPCFVSFSADAIPTQIDQSSANPGPGGAAANRAGYTTVKFDGKGVLSFVPASGAARRDGTIPFYFISVNVFFRLTDFSVKVSSDYPAGSCAYNATVRHELNAHIKSPIKIMYGYRDALVNRLNVIPLPTQQLPRWIRPAEMEMTQKTYQDQVYRIVADVRSQVSAALKADRIDQDGPAKYKAVYDQCPAVEWNRTR